MGKEIRISVRDLVEFVMRAGDLDEDLAGIVGGSGVSGKARYVSESGHVIYIGKNRGGIIKRPDGKYRFETYAFVDRFGRGPFCFFVEPYSK